jgi:phosphoglucosamine mutase
VLVRASGTEPLLRVMVDAAYQQLVDHWSIQLAAAAEQHLNAV